MEMFEIQVMADAEWNPPMRTPRSTVRKIQESGRLVRARCVCCRSAWILLSQQTTLPGPLCKGCKQEAEAQG